MKKALVLVLAALVTAAWAAPALAAQARFSYGGFMRFKYGTGNAGTLPGPESADASNFGGLRPDDTVSEWRLRWRQFFDLRPNEHVRTTVAFEVNADFGDENVLGGGSGDLQFGNASRQEVQFRVKRALLQFDAPGAPVTLVVGQQSFASAAEFLNDEDGTGIKLRVKALGGEHTLFWSRPLHGSNNQAAGDDADWFGIEPRFEFGGLTVRPLLSYLTTGNSVTRQNLRDVDVFLGELVVDGKAGPVGLRLDLGLQVGETGAEPGLVGGCTPAPKCDVFSYIASASATLGAGPGTLLVKAFYSPGDDNPTDKDLDAWISFLHTDLHFTSFFFDGVPGGGAGALEGFSTAAGANASGIIGAGAEFTLTPVKNLAVTPTVYYLQAAEDKIAPGEPSNGENFYGWEAGIHALWKIWDAVELYANFDYIFTGDYFKNAAGQTKDAWRVVVGPNISW